jgi:hypothetical protein
MNRDDLLAVRNFGEKSLNELVDRLIQRRFLPAVRQIDANGAGGASAVTDEDDEDLE